MSRRPRKIHFGFLVIGLLLLAVYAYGLIRHPMQRTTDHAPLSLTARSKTAGCTVTNALPDPSCTPGAALSSATATEICASGYSGKVRNVTEAEKQAVYAEYGIFSHSPGEYEVDHLISLELGGSNDISNLWPEAARPTPGFHEKDAVENWLHEQVCSGKLNLPAAQLDVISDWTVMYRQISGS